MLDAYLAFLGGLALALGLTSRRVRQLPVSEPLLALVIGVVIGPAVLGLVELPESERNHVLSEVARIAVALSLMAVALRFPIRDFRSVVPAVAILILVVLPAMAAIGGLLGIAVLGLPVASAALLGAAIAPTDPVLASSIVTGDPAERDLPERLRVLLSLESAVNDALALPLVLVATAAITATAMPTAAGRALLHVAVAVVLGLLIGDGAGRLVLREERHRVIEHSAFLVLMIALALFTLGAVKLLGGEGILGVLAAGLAYNHRLSRAERELEEEVQEAINRFLVLPVFTLLGVALPWEAWRSLGWPAAVFVAGVLLVRRLPLLLVLRRPLGLRRDEAAFLGWFGPVGAAALFYVTHALYSGTSALHLWAAGSLTIAASTLVHGVTATPLRRAFATSRERVAQASPTTTTGQGA